MDLPPPHAVPGLLHSKKGRRPAQSLDGSPFSCNSVQLPNPRLVILAVAGAVSGGSLHIIPGIILIIVAGAVLIAVAGAILAAVSGAVS